MFNIGEFYTEFFESTSFKNESQSVYGKFKIAIGGCVMFLLDLIEIVIDLVGIQFGRQAIEMQRQLGNMPTIAVEGGI